MNVNERDRRADTGAKRDVGQLTPRSGGRIAAERARRTTGGRSLPPTGGRSAPSAAGSRPVPQRVDQARSARSYPTRGSAALRPEELTEPVSPQGVAGTRETGRSTKLTAAPQRNAARLRVAPPPPVTVPRAPFVALILVLVVGGVLGILVVNTKINENSFRLGKLQQEQAALDLRQQELEKQIADAKAPGSLVAQARKLGLVDSGPPAFIRLPDGRVIGVPRPAGGQPAITSQQAGG